MKPCNSDQIRNPKTKRCVKKTGSIGKQILEGISSPKKYKKSPRKNVEKKCRDDQVYNPKSKRCVKKTGSIGKQILEGTSPKKKILTPPIISSPLKHFEKELQQISPKFPTNQTRFLIINSDRGYLNTYYGLLYLVYKFEEQCVIIPDFYDKDMKLKPYKDMRLTDENAQ